MKYIVINLLLALLAFCLNQVLSGTIGSGVDFSSVKSSGKPNLVMDLKKGKATDTEIHKAAIAFLEEIQGSSSCHQLAAYTLIQVCQSIEGASTTIDPSLSNAKEEYAAKMAVCELSAARPKNQDAVPKQCMDLIPTKTACDTSSSSSTKICYHPLSRARITACITALRAHPQSWTSYSNAAQNVVNTCHASRVHMNQDEIISRLTAVLKAQVTAAQDTADLIRNNGDQVLGEFQRVEESVQQIRASVDRLGGEVMAQSYKIFANMNNNFQTLYDSLLANLTSANDLVLAGNAKKLAAADEWAIAFNQFNSKVMQDLASNVDEVRTSVNHIVANALSAVEYVHESTIQLKNQTKEFSKLINDTHNQVTDFVSAVSPSFAVIRYIHDIIHSTWVDRLTWYSLVFNVVILIIVVPNLLWYSEFSAAVKMLIALMMDIALYSVFCWRETRPGYNFFRWLFTSKISGLSAIAGFMIGLLFAKHIIRAFHRLLNSLLRQCCAPAPALRANDVAVTIHNGRRTTQPHGYIHSTQQANE
ncbi:hypothetical protein, variant [Verruconis gallopava]|uniref:Karyogamy protein 5 n=1 Tax=Verruconis gallopava TaxID=253628 RepID=A0A0D2ABW1_9PEZI|nr:hypothetical protein, variant [Verruconis gallopava]KIW04333.1 hypothetical protein, variant [Verruconis gallopava]